jgi:hypothetical protein
VAFGGKHLNLEVFAYIMLVAGALGDHLSTFLALARPYVYEANPIVLKLMEKGLWFPVDIVLIALGIIVPYLLIRVTKTPVFKGLLAYPLVHGLIRIAVSFWNIGVLIP